MSNSPDDPPPPIFSEEQQRLFPKVDAEHDNTMTSDAAIVRPEGRKGDAVAKYVVLVCFMFSSKWQHGTTLGVYSWTMID